MAVFSVTTPLAKDTSTFSGFHTYGTTLTGSSSTSFNTTALKGFSGDATLTGTITPGASLAITSEYIYIDVSIDGTNWGVLGGKTYTTSGSTTDVRSFYFDLTGITAPYFRIRFAATSFSSTIAIKYAVKKI